MALRLLALLLIVCLPQAATAQQPVPSLAVADARLARVAERLQGANAALCRQIMPLTGMILHSADQYPAPDPQWFAQGPVAVAQVLPGSPADVAGVRANDALLAIGGHELAQPTALALPPGAPLRDTAFALLAAQDPALPLTLGLHREGRGFTVSVRAPAGCRALAEALSGAGNTALSDGRVIQLSEGLVLRLGEEQLAVLVAHELAHAVLEHRRRLEDAGVEQGAAGQFGQSRRLARQAEVEADLLSLHLLANAGWDPAIAPRFWRDPASAPVGGGGILRSRIYPSRAERARAMEAEIAAYLAGRPLPSPAAHLLARRDQPFGD